MESRDRQSRTGLTALMLLLKSQALFFVVVVAFEEKRNFWPDCS